MDNTVEFYRKLYFIRRFEETVLDEFGRGTFSGTTHTYLGQEANAVGVLHNLDTEDVVVSNHRCHGHFLAYGGDPRALFAELMGKASGVCAGRGGSQHLHWRNFYSNGILGVPFQSPPAWRWRRNAREATPFRSSSWVMEPWERACVRGAKFRQLMGCSDPLCGREQPFRPDPRQSSSPWQAIFLPGSLLSIFRSVSWIQAM
jgi:hypothetical protein